MTSLHIQLSYLLVVVVFLSKFILCASENQSANATTVLGRTERASADEPDDFINIESAALFEESPHSNGSKIARSLAPNQRTQRSSSFRLEDNGSKLHYLRTAANEFSNRGEMEKLLSNEGESVLSDDLNALFCYYQSVQVGYELGPSVTKCTIRGHDACMLLENTRSGVREMSCISASDCEQTRVELMRSKTDGNVKLTCCRTNLCNSPSSRPKTLPPANSDVEKPAPATASSGMWRSNGPTRQQRAPSLRDKHPFQSIEEPLFPAVPPDSSMNSRLAQSGLSESSLGQLQFVSSQQVVGGTPRNNRGGASARSSVVASNSLRQAASLLEKPLGRPGHRIRGTTAAPFWSNVPSAIQSSPNAQWQSADNTQDSDGSISSLINRVLNSRGGSSQKPAHKLNRPAQSLPFSPVDTMNSAPVANSASGSNSKSGMAPSPEQDLYQQMMLLLGSANGEIANKAFSINNQRKAPEAGESRLPQSSLGGLLAASVCDFPPLMPNAWVSVASLEVGSEVYYQCNSGYQLEGPRVVSCTDIPSGTTASPFNGRFSSRPRWTQVPSCVRLTEGQFSDKFVESSDLASQAVPRSSSNDNIADNIIGDHYKSLSDVGPVTVASPLPSDMSLSFPAGGNSNDELDPPLGGPSSGPDDRRGSPSDRVMQCYDNRAGSVFVASCRGDSVICTRIVTSGTSALSLLTPESAPALGSSPFGVDAASPALGESVSSGRSNSGQQQVSQYCALLDDCLRFERWVRLAHREDIDVLCCSTDLCNA